MHLLLLIRDEETSRRHPLDVLSEAALLASVRTKVDALRPLLLAECRRLLGPADDNDDDDDDRDGLVMGVHAAPSMNHVHLHILSPDLTGESLRTRHHFNSFTTPFLVPLDRFPLAAGDEIRDPAVKARYRDGEMTCPRCGQALKNMPVVRAHMKGHLTISPTK